MSDSRAQGLRTLLKFAGMSQAVMALAVAGAASSATGGDQQEPGCSGHGCCCGQDHEALAADSTEGSGDDADAHEPVPPWRFPLQRGPSWRS